MQRGRGKISMEKPLPVHTVVSTPHRETRIGFMEKVKLETLQLHCRECRAVFYYVNDTNDQLKPKYCPECGRRNLGN
jgi:hypothetical protein